MIVDEAGPAPTAAQRAVARHQRKAELRKMIEQDAELRRLKIEEIIMRAYATGMLYVPPTRFKIDRDCVCLACGAQDEHAAGCRPPVGLRRLTLKEIRARNDGTNAEASAVRE